MALKKEGEVLDLTMFVERSDEALTFLRRDPRDPLDLLGARQDRLQGLTPEVAHESAGERLTDSRKEPAGKIGDDRNGLARKLAQGMDDAKLRPPLRVSFPLSGKCELVAGGD